MIQQNKVVIIGAGHVGSAVLTNIASLGIVSQIVMVDTNREKAEGEVLDLSHTTSFTYSPNVELSAGDYSDCADANIIVITAGPSISTTNGVLDDRSTLASINSKVIKDIMKSITAYTREAIIIVVTNPLDICTYTAVKSSGYPREKVIGTGTLLDTARFRKILASFYGLDAKNLHGYILGEHGQTAFAAWSLVNIAGMPLPVYEEVVGCNPVNRDKILQDTVNIGFNIVKKKGSTNLGVAGAVARLVKAVLIGEKSILPVSCVLNGEYGLRDVALSIPCIINKKGIEKTLEVRLSDDELESLNKSSDYIKSLLKDIEN